MAIPFMAIAGAAKGAKSIYEAFRGDQAPKLLYFYSDRKATFRKEDGMWIPSSAAAQAYIEQKGVTGFTYPDTRELKTGVTAGFVQIGSNFYDANRFASKTFVGEKVLGSGVKRVKFRVYRQDTGGSVNPYSPVSGKTGNAPVGFKTSGFSGKALPLLFVTGLIAFAVTK